MLKIINDFCEAIDLSQSKVKNGPQKITLFGGHITNSNGQVLSQRGTFLCIAGKLADSLVVPENYKNWNQFGMYNDLLSFEEDVCTLVDVVLVFLETEGAIAEFAALIKHENIAPKLLIVVNQEHYESDSFIKLGLLRYLEAAHKGSDNIVVAHNNPLIRAELDHILKLLEQRSQQQPKIESFRQKNLRHIFYLIVDFIDILQVARISDIQLMLKKLGISYSKNRLEQLLSALKNAELIREDKMLSERCFSAISTPRASIEYAFVKSPGKRVTWKARAFENTLGDKWRAYAFRTLKSKDISKSEVVNGA